jgi:tetratricopeptide (TPR) repeat protein
MDCRKGWWLCVGLVIGGIGCKSLGTTTNAALPTPAGQPVAMEVTKEKELPKKPMSPSLCVSIGTFQENEAADPQRTAIEKEQFLNTARGAFQAALQTDPNYLPALKALAHLYTILPDHDRAIDTYQRALKTYPKDASLWFELAVYQSQCKEWAPAVENMRQALAFDPENRLYANRLGYCLARAGRYEESLVCFQQIVGPAQAHYNVARMQLHMNQEEAAKQSLHLAIQADPQHKDARQLLTQLDASNVQQTSFQTGPARPGIKVDLED